MNDNDVIKALEYIADTEDYELEDYPDVRAYNAVKVINLAINLINRLQAEIEGLEAEVDEQYEQAKADILGNMADGGVSCHWCIAQHEAKARKEFAERVHGIISPEYGGYHKAIDKLLEEMEKGGANNG